MQSNHKIWLGKWGKKKASSSVVDVVIAKEVEQQLNGTT